jgi:hypothetical protein
MSVYSMTGYASAALRSPARPWASRPAVTAEVRSVNGRFLDLSLRLPDELRGLEPALRELVAASVQARQDRTATGHAAREATPGRRPPRAAQPPGAAGGEVQGWLPKRRPVGERGAAVVPGRHRGRAAGRGRAGSRARCVEGLREARAREGARLAAMLMDRVAICANWPRGRAAGAAGGAAPAAAFSGALERSPGQRPRPAAACLARRCRNAR